MVILFSVRLLNCHNMMSDNRACSVFMLPWRTRVLFLVCKLFRALLLPILFFWWQLDGIYLCCIHVVVDDSWELYIVLAPESCWLIDSSLLGCWIVLDFCNLGFGEGQLNCLSPTLDWLSYFCVSNSNVCFVFVVSRFMWQRSLSFYNLFQYYCK